ncbi:MAG TPA: hypothetical protein VHS58_02890 [Acetobacteraceae bacterium]|nr:hypothetical protein [Acetobacteraceae bacterium]
MSAWYLLLPAYPPDPAGRFAWIMRALREAVAARHRFIPQPLLFLIHARLGGIAQRFASIAAKVQAGTLRPPRVRPALRQPSPRQPSPRKPYERLPRRFAWLSPLVPGDAVGLGLNLVQLLGEPGMQALLKAAPQLTRILRPLCRMLAAEPTPDLLPPLPPRPPRPKRAKPPRAAAVPRLPTFRTRGGQLMMKLSDSISVPVAVSKNRA